MERLDNSIFQRMTAPKGLIYMVPAVGVEPTRSRGTRDFESRASTSSTTPAHRREDGKEQKNWKNYNGRWQPCQEKIVDRKLKRMLPFLINLIA